MIIWRQNNHGALYVPAAGGGSPTTIYGPATLNLNDSGDANYSFRVVVPTSGAGGSQVRVTLQASSAAAFDVDNVSVGKSSGTNGDTLATPVSLLFSGAANKSISAGTTATSDWGTFTVTASDTLVVIFDVSATNGNPAWANAGVTGVTTYFKSGSDSYNQTTLASMTQNLNANWAVSKIEVQ
jgi:hypothetical protein